MKKKKLTLEQLQIESIKLRHTLTTEQLDLLDFDEWLETHGWTQFELEFHLKLRRDLISATLGFEDDDDE